MSAAQRTPPAHAHAPQTRAARRPQARFCGAGKPVGNSPLPGDNARQLWPCAAQAGSYPDLSRALCVQPARLSTAIVRGQLSGARALFWLIPSFVPALLTTTT